MVRHGWLAVVAVLALSAAFPPSALAQLSTWEDEQRRAEAEKDAAEARKKKVPAKPRTQAPARESRESLNDDEDTTAPLGGLTGAAGTCGGLALNLFGGAVVAAGLSGLALLPGIALISSCGPLLACAPLFTAAAGSVVFLFTGAVGSCVGPLAGAAAANFGAHRRVALLPLSIAVTVPTVLAFLVSILVEAPLVMAAMYAGFNLGAALYDEQNPGQCVSGNCTRPKSVRQAVIQGQTAVLVLTLMGVFAAPAMGLLLGSAVGGALAALVAALTGRGMRGEEKGYHFDVFSVPTLTEEEERQARLDRRRARSRDDDDDAPVKRRPKKRKAPEEKEIPALDDNDEDEEAPELRAPQGPRGRPQPEPESSDPSVY